jgi:hypothetical protein
MQLAFLEEELILTHLASIIPTLVGTALLKV